MLYPFFLLGKGKNESLQTKTFICIYIYIYRKQKHFVHAATLHYNQSDVRMPAAVALAQPAFQLSQNSDLAPPSCLMF